MSDDELEPPDYGKGWKSPAGSLPPSGLVEMRRADRGKDDRWIRAFLAAAPWGVLATVEDGRPFLNSNLFVYDPAEHAIYLHTAQVGRTRASVERSGGAADPADADPETATRVGPTEGAVHSPGGAPVAFTAGTVGRLLPADEALEFSVEYAAVVVLGRGRVVEEGVEKERALQALLDKYAPHLEPGRDYRPIVPKELRRTAVYRVDVEAWSGKQKAVAPDFPGAFPVEGPGIPFEAD